MKKKISRKFLLRRILVCLLVILIILLIKNLIYSIFFNKPNNEIKLLLNNEITNTINDIYIEDTNIYISKEDIQNIFDKNIYYNVGDQELITTYNKHVAVMHLNSNQMIVNDAVLPIDGTLKEIDSNIYLPLSDLGIVYDLEIDFSEKTNLVICDSLSKAKTKAMSLKNTKIKKSKLPFSVKIEKINRGDTLYIIESEKRWLKVRTENGNIGYIKSRKVSTPKVEREDMIEEEKKFNILEDCSDISSSYQNIMLSTDKENVVILENFTFNKDSSIIEQIDAQSENYQKYHDWAEQNEIKILANFKRKCKYIVNFGYL